MMNVPYYPVQTATQMPVYQQPNYTTAQPVQYTQTQTQYGGTYPQQTPQQISIPPQVQTPMYPPVQTGMQAPVQAPVQAPQAAPQIDTSRIGVQLATELVAECAALVELNKCAVNVAKEIQETQDPNKKARLQTHSQDLNQLIALREAKVNQLQAQYKQYEN